MAGCFSKAGSRGCAPESASHFEKKPDRFIPAAPSGPLQTLLECPEEHTHPAIGRAWLCLAQCPAALGRARPRGQARMPGLGPRELGPSMVGSSPRVWGLRPHAPEPVVRVSHSASRWPRSLHPQASRSPRMTLFSCLGASCHLLPPTPAALTLSSAQPVCLGSSQPGLASQTRPQAAPLASPRLPSPRQPLCPTPFAHPDRVPTCPRPLGLRGA